MDTIDLYSLLGFPRLRCYYADAFSTETLRCNNYQFYSIDWNTPCQTCPDLHALNGGMVGFRHAEALIG